jgi:hypothetical protein
MRLTFNMLNENFNKDSNEIINLYAETNNNHVSNSCVWGDSSIVLSASKSKRTKTHMGIRKCLRAKVEVLRS